MQTTKPMTKEQELIKVQEEYIKLLSDDISSNAVYLNVHGIKTPQYRIDKGIELRKLIKKLQNNAND